MAAIKDKNYLNGKLNVILDMPRFHCQTLLLKIHTIFITFIISQYT